MATRKIWRQQGILGGCILSLLVLGNADAEARRKKKNTSNNTAGVTQFVPTQNIAGSNNAAVVPFLASQSATLTQEAGLGWCRKTTAMLNYRPSGTMEDFNFVTVVEQLRDPQTGANEQFRKEVIQKLPQNVQQIFTQIWNLPANATQLDEPMCCTVRDCPVTIFNQRQILEGGAFNHSLVSPEAYAKFAKWCSFIVGNGLKGLKKEVKEPLVYIIQNLYVQNAQGNGGQPPVVNEQTVFLLALLLQRLDDVSLMYEFADIKAKLEPIVQTLTNSQVNWTITDNEVRLATVLTSYLYGQINSFLANRQLRELIDSGALSSPLTDWLRWGARLIMAPFPDGQNLGRTLLQAIMATMLPALNAMAVSLPTNMAGNAPVTNQSNPLNLQLPRMTSPALQGPSAPNPANNTDLSKLLATVQNPQNAVSPGTVTLPLPPATSQVIALGGTNSAPNPLTAVAPSYANQSAYANQNQLLAALSGYGAGTNLQNQNQPQKNQPQQKEEKKGFPVSVNDINSILKTLNSFRQPPLSN